MIRKIFTIVSIIVLGGVILSSCKKDATLETPKYSVKKDVINPGVWDKYCFAAMHGGPTDCPNPTVRPPKPIHPFYDAVSYLCYRSQNDPELVPQTGYFTDTTHVRFSPDEMVTDTQNNFWYHLYSPSDGVLPDVYNEYHTREYWDQYYPAIKALALEKLQEMMVQPGGPDGGVLRIKTVGFGNDCVEMPDGDGWYGEEIPPGDYHGIHWISYGYWYEN